MAAIVPPNPFSSAVIAQKLNDLPFSYINSQLLQHMQFLQFMLSAGQHNFKQVVSLCLQAFSTGAVNTVKLPSFFSVISCALKNSGISNHTKAQTLEQLVGYTGSCHEGLQLQVQSMIKGKIFSINPHDVDSVSQPDRLYLDKILHLLQDPSRPKFVSRYAHVVLAAVLQNVSEDLTNTDWQIMSTGLNRLFNIDTEYQFYQDLQIFLEVLKLEGPPLKQIGLIIMPTLLHNLKEKSSLNVITLVGQIFDEAPQIFRDFVPQVTSLAKQLFNAPGMDKHMKDMIVKNILTVIVKKFPSHFKNHPSDFLLVLELVFLNMIQIPAEIPENWLNPQPGVQEDPGQDPDNAPIFQGMETIDEMFESVDCQSLAPIIIECLSGFRDHPDWRYNFVALMVLSQLPEYLKKKCFFNSIYEIVLKNIDNPCHKVRYACFQVIGQTVDDKRQIIHKQFFDITLQAILNGLEDPIIRVASHAMACFTNFGEKCEYHKLKNHIPHLLNICITAIDSPYNFVVQNGLSALHQLFGCLGQNHIKTIDYIFLMSKLEALMKSEFRNIRLQSLETGSKLLHELDLSKADFNMHEHVSYIKLILMSSLDSVSEYENQYYLNTFRKLIKIEEHKFFADTEQINKMLSLCLNSIQNFFNDQDNLIVSFELIKLIITYSRGIPIYQEIQKLISKIKANDNQEFIELVGSKCADLYISLISRAHETQLPNIYLKIFYKYFEQLVDKIRQDDQQLTGYSTLVQDIDVIKEALNVCNLYVNTSTITELKNRLIKLMTRVMNFHNHITTNDMKSPDLDEETYKALESSIDDLQSALQSCLEIIEIFYQKYSKEVGAEVLTYIVDEFCPRCLNQQREDMINLGIYSICDIIDYVNFSQLAGIWQNLLTILVKNVHSTNHSVRQSSSYGLGVFIKRTPSSAINFETTSSIAKALLEVLEVPADEENQKKYFYAQDNVLAALGHVTFCDKIQPEIQKQCLVSWLSHLPLRGDKVEGKQQHQKLLNLDLGQTLATSGDILVLLLKALAGLYQNRKMSNKQLDARIIQKVKELCSRPDLLHLSDYVWDRLSDVERSKLTEIQMTGLEIKK